jgi:gluconate 2-dehydrogenase alpha chain
MQGESPAYRQNYADLDPTYRDSYGHPLIRITFNFTDNERKMVKYVADKVLAPIIGQMNPARQQVTDTIGDFDSVPYQSTHVTGGTIMGSDPSSSVVNKYCQVWGVPNLFGGWGEQLPAERRLQPDWHRGRAGLSHRGRARRSLRE